MVLGADGRKMSKSLKNYAAAPEVLNKNGADATRQWAAGGGATGSDIPYRAQDVEYGRRFLVKLWNASGFTANLLAEYKPVSADKVHLEPIDRWIISKAENITKKVTDEFEKCQFNLTIEDVRNFTWHVFCDYYLEAVKDRLYNPDMRDSASRLAAQYTLYEVLYRILQLLAPVTPHVTEEIYQVMFKGHKGFESLQISPWPKFNPTFIDEKAEKREIYLSVPSVKDDSRKLSTNCRLTCHSPVSKFIRAARKMLGFSLKARKVIASTLKLIEFNNIKIDCRKSGHHRAN